MECAIFVDVTKSLSNADMLFFYIHYDTNIC